MLSIHKIRFTFDGEIRYSMHEFYDVELAIILAEGIFEIKGVTYVEVIKTKETVVWSAKERDDGKRNKQINYNSFMERFI